MDYSDAVIDNFIIFIMVCDFFLQALFNKKGIVPTKNLFNDSIDLVKCGHLFGAAKKSKCFFFQLNLLVDKVILLSKPSLSCVALILKKLHKSSD